ncbi:molybdenum cofactor guanylyltransferase [Phenylobacterium soli]|uniref:Molybdenum cofactor guanylyltransferase n=1 Tax=Phenylobacterium soli TaxID=2170551 RepID=A0A328AMD1_9CAUL|nr:molybdenum cofactor guanylyltransferase [Phenylobacterium soli]RAK55146.1 molybdenum cofactor guanylyltransferase MobA [Phenylobacterium soli]
MKTLCVILAGGEGRRMGGDKPLRAWGGSTLIGNAVRLARRAADEVAVAVRDPRQVGPVGAHVILDDPAIEGPLAGIAAALRAAHDLGHEALLTLPCDMPRLPEDLLPRLAAALDAAPGALAAVACTDGELHPVCALWRAAAVERLPAYVESGARSLKGFAATCAYVTADWPAEAAERFANANTPDELERLRRLAAGG